MEKDDWRVEHIRRRRGEERSIVTRRGKRRGLSSYLVPLPNMLRTRPVDPPQRERKKERKKTDEEKETGRGLQVTRGFAFTSTARMSLIDSALPQTDGRTPGVHTLERETRSENPQTSPSFFQWN